MDPENDAYNKIQNFEQNGLKMPKIYDSDDEDDEPLTQLIINDPGQLRYISELGDDF